MDLYKFSQTLKGVNVLKVLKKNVRSPVRMKDMMKKIGNLQLSSLSLQRYCYVNIFLFFLNNNNNNNNKL